MDRIYIGLPKGRFIDFSKSFAQKHFAEYEFGEMAPGTSYLLSECDRIVVLFLKASDIPNLLNENRIDIGVAPSEWCLEHNLEANRALSCISPSLSTINVDIKVFSVHKTWPRMGTLKIATSFPNITRQFFNKEKLVDLGHDCIEIVRASGSIESITMQMCDVGVDCVETGKSIRDHDLNILDTIHRGLDLSMWSNDKGSYLLKNYG